MGVSTGEEWRSGSAVRCVVRMILIDAVPGSTDRSACVVDSGFGMIAMDDAAKGVDGKDCKSLVLSLARVTGGPL